MSRRECIGLRALSSRAFLSGFCNDASLRILPTRRGCRAGVKLRSKWMWGVQDKRVVLAMRSSETSLRQTCWKLEFRTFYFLYRLDMSESCFHRGRYLSRVPQKRRRLIPEPACGDDVHSLFCWQGICQGRHVCSSQNARRETRR